MMNQLMPKRKVEREVPVKTARKILADDFADELIDQETANQEALELAEQMVLSSSMRSIKQQRITPIVVKMFQDKVYNEISYQF